jgi:hypothetical protein
MSSNEFANPQALVQQITQATDRLSDQEAAQRYQQILGQLPPEQAAELNALALSQVGQDERRSLAGQFRQAHQNPNTPFDGYDFDDDDEAASPLGLGRMSARAQHQDPSLLGGMLGENSPLGGTLGKAALGALAAILIRQAMSGQQSRSHGQGGQMGGDPISAILGGLLGGGAGGLGGLGGQQMPGGLGGGGSYGGQQMPTGQQMPGGLDLGSILSGVLGSGSMARQTPQGGGLGSLLGSILGGAMGGGSGSHRR